MNKKLQRDGATGKPYSIGVVIRSNIKATAVKTLRL